VNFTGLPGEGSLKIYNSIGELVKEQPLGSDGRAVWNVSDVNSGVYLYEVNSPSVIKMGKVVVIR